MPRDQQHRGPQVHPRTENVYHHLMMPAIRSGATVMGDIFVDNDDAQTAFWIFTYIEKRIGKPMGIRVSRFRT